MIIGGFERASARAFSVPLERSLARVVYVPLERIASPYRAACSLEQFPYFLSRAGGRPPLELVGLVVYGPDLRVGLVRGGLGFLQLG